ncbi:hypothetical protein JCM10908_000635 [Rhodotorula pacifica]|uniref:uncharacterized protein n=1 Tax=Rhodotorula pacifica TaxID=1495444 RepID=UPI0031768BB8
MAPSTAASASLPPASPSSRATAGLPTLSLAGPALRIKDINAAASTALRIGPPTQRDEFSGSRWLRPTVSEITAESTLAKLAQDTSTYEWGRDEPPILHYWLGETEAAAEVLVSVATPDAAATDDKVYTIVFLRPIPVHAPPPPELEATHAVPPRRFASRVPQLDTVSAAGSSASSTTSVSPAANGIPVAISPSSLQSLVGSSEGTSRSASFSSGHSISSRKTNRPTVGPERRNLPLSPEATSMLAHATGLVTNNKSNASSRRESIDTPAAESSRASPWATTAEQVATAALEDKLPLSVSVLVGRTKSFDRGIEALSDGTDRGAGKPLPYRVPTRAEQDASPPPRQDTALRSATPPRESQEVGQEQKTAATEDSTMGGATPPAVDDTRPASPAPSLESTRRQALTVHNLVDLVETVPMILFMADLNGQVTWLNKEWYNYTGADPAFNMSFEEWMSMFHPDDLQEVLPTYLTAMQTGSKFKFKYRIKRHDGALRWHACQGAPVRDEHGTVTSWVCSVSDVHEDTEARHDALLVKERTKAVLEGSDIFLLTVSPRLEVVLFEGKPPCTVPKDAPDSLVGCNFAELWPSSALQDAVQRILDGELERDYVQIDEQDPCGKTVHHRCRLIALRGDPAIPQIHPDADAITGCIIVGSDVTELFEAESALQKAAASEHAAREANRLKTQFLTTITHEIRTPIAGILGICEILLGDSSRLNDDQRSLIQQAVRSADTLLELIGAVLDLRKVEENALSLETGPFLLTEALNDARLFSVIAQKKGLEFVEDVEPVYPGTLLGDRLRLRQILANALSNAVKFTKSGSVTLACSQLYEDDKRVVVQLEVRDTGIGIDPAVLPTLFEPFRQADPSTAREFGGTGLGLSISKKLVELMDGTISLHSNFGAGSTVTITVSFPKAPLLDVVDFVGTTQDVPIPTEQEAAKVHRAEEMVEQSRNDARPSDVRVLLAEDNDLIRQIVTRILKGKGFSVDAVEDGRKCLEQLENAEYDVVLMDGQMPHLDGYEATKIIRQSSDPRLRNLRIIALTASAIKGDRERCLDAGMDTYLAKPVRAAELEATIWRQVELVGSPR